MMIFAYLNHLLFLVHYSAVQYPFPFPDLSTNKPAKLSFSLIQAWGNHDPQRGNNYYYLIALKGVIKVLAKDKQKASEILLLPQALLLEGGKALDGLGIRGMSRHRCQPKYLLVNTLIFESKYYLITK